MLLVHYGFHLCNLLSVWMPSLTHWVIAGLAPPSSTWRVPSWQVQPIDQTFYFHAADRWGAETPCSQVCKGAQGPPSPRSPVTFTGADAALAVNCPEADDKSGRPTSPWENAKQLELCRDWEIRTRLRWAAEPLLCGLWSASSQAATCVKVFLQGHPASRRKKFLVLTGLIHGVFMIASLVFSPFSTSGQPPPCFSAS